MAGAGVMMHQLPLVYAGYGLLGGAGWGLGYISPVSTLMKWFPDRRGMAAGLGLAFFGGGAMVATPINEFLLKHYFQAPTYLGSAADGTVNLITKEGVRLRRKQKTREDTSMRGREKRREKRRERRRCGGPLQMRKVCVVCCGCVMRVQ